jgi:aminoglycoside phosphotransferase (APT) family kinase protein
VDFIDRTRAIRPGEELDLVRLEPYLRKSIPGLDGPIEVEQFPGGYSNLTYLIRCGDREMVLRRPPFGKKAKTAHDMGREYRILKALRPSFPCCPEPLLYTEDESILSCPFFVMERIRGIILRRDLPKGMSFTPEEARKLCENLVDVLVDLHGIDVEKAGLRDFGKPEGYVQRQVEGWSGRYRNARTPDAPDFEAVMGWLTEKRPSDSGRVSVIHNDYRFDNVVLHPDDPFRVIGILDWEMATIGDPLMDLGGALAYWVEKDDPPDRQVILFGPTNLEGALTRDGVIERYLAKTGMVTPAMDFYLTFGLFRLAVIAQQIYYRFYHGQTKDQRFQMMIVAVQVLEKEARKLIDGSSL